MPGADAGSGHRGGQGPTASVIVVSRGRPRELARCLTALGQQVHHPCEIVVVADPAGVAAVRAHPLGPAVVTVPFDRAGVAAARNAGLAASAGEVVAFIDDDAVAEPMWLAHLLAPFAEPEVAAAGGFVRGRNGISYQWRGRSVDREGRHAPIDTRGDAPFAPVPAPGTAIRTEGTNMAVRRAVLARLGGFDPAFRFYMDDTDLNMRLAEAGLTTVLVPRAQVQHAVAASERRRPDRMPRDLTEIGAGTARFLARHCPAERRGAALAARREEERRRLLRHMVAGRCMPGDVARLLAGFDAGAEAAAAEAAPGPGWTGESAAAFRPLREEAPAPRTTVLAGRPWQAVRLRAEAAAAADRGEIVTLFLLSPTTLYHRMRYREAGYWEQAGGLFGRSVRSGPVFRLTGFRARVAEEARRIADVRHPAGGRDMPVAPGADNPGPLP